MIRPNPGTGIPPDIVLEVARVLEARLGRTTHVRQVKNRSAWYITDPIFSYVQRGLHKGVTGYRAGYFFDSDADDLAFQLVHSPVMAGLFKSNLHLSTIVAALEGCKKFLPSPFLMWSSKSASRRGEKWRVLEGDWEDFMTTLREMDERWFVGDLFPKLSNQKTGRGPAKWAGNDFYLLFSERASSLSKRAIAKIVSSSWPLFLCLYPIAAIEQRVASLSRNLRAAGLVQECEYLRIRGLPSDSKVLRACRGQIEGAHVKPHSTGGSDRLENGLWLCRHHHRATEGLLLGSRSRESFEISYVE